MPRFALILIALGCLHLPLWGQSSDFNGDGTIDLNDFFLFADSYGQSSGPALQRYDLDGSGAVDFGDFFAFSDAVAAEQGRFAPCVEPAVEKLGILLASKADFDRFLPQDNRCVVLIGTLKITDENVSQLHRLGNVIQVENITISEFRERISQENLSLSFKRLERISGDFVVQKNELSITFTAPILSKISGNFVLQDNEGPIVLETPLLSEISGSVNFGSDYYFSTFNGVPFPVDGWFVDSEDILNFSGLHSLKKIGGNLHIVENLPASNSDIFDQLESVGGDLILYKSDHEIVDSFLKNVILVGGILWIENTSLSNIDFLRNLKSVGKSIYIKNNKNIKNLDGIKFLEYGGDSTLLIENNAALENLDVLGSIAHKFRTIDIDNNPFLVRIDGDERPVVFPGSLIIRNSSALESMSWMEEIEFVGGGLDIRQTGLTDMDDLENLKYVRGKFIISINENLIDLGGLGNLRRIDGPIKIENNIKLKDQNRIEKINRLNNNFRFNPNDVNNDEFFFYFHTPIIVKHSIAYHDCSGQSGHSCHAIYDCEIKICDDEELIDYQTGGAIFHLDGSIGNFTEGGGKSMPSLVSMSGDLNLYSGMIVPDLRIIGGDLTIISRSRNIDFSDPESRSKIIDLSNLTTVKGSLTIKESFLPDLSLLENLRTLNGDLMIIDNDDLPTSVAHAFVERLRANGFDGLVTISGNKEG